jgi:hypothetical protein
MYRLKISSSLGHPFMKIFEIMTVAQYNFFSLSANLGIGETGRTQGSEGWLPGN